MARKPSKNKIAEIIVEIAIPVVIYGIQSAIDRWPWYKPKKAKASNDEKPPEPPESTDPSI